MLTRPVLSSEKHAYNQSVHHPLQSWEWGEFRKKTAVTVERFGIFSDKTLEYGVQATFHRVPGTTFTVGYVPKGDLPTPDVLEQLKLLGQQHQAIFITLEPNIHSSQVNQLSSLPLRPAAKPLFTKYTFHLDLRPSEEELLKKMHPKTRYNIRVAQKHGVTVQEENTEEAFAHYLALTHETTQRQGFYAHSDEYHQKMWETLRPAGMAHLLTARYKGKIVATWILFLFNNVLYYPYGASTSAHKEVMASNLMMWEAMRWGKHHGAALFDLWGTPGSNPSPSDPYYGFHRFKLGYGPKLVEFVGSYDLVLRQPHYTLFTLANNIRWQLLKLKTKIL